MKPVKTAACNWSFHLPGRPGEGDMPCMKVEDPPATRSFWALEDSDDELLNGSAPIICVQTYGFARIDKALIGFGDHGGETNIDMREGMEHDGGRQFQVPVNEVVRDHMRRGGLFILEVPMCPPMPVSVWIAE